MEQMTSVDKGIEFGLQIATGAIEKIDIDRLWDENRDSLDCQTATVADLMIGFTRKLVYEMLGEWADKTIAEADTDEAGQEILKALSERLGIEIDIQEEESAEESEPPKKLKLVE